MRESSPEVVEGVRGNRAFLARAVRHLAGERGIRQFLDIGTGLPAAVLVHARALMQGDPRGRTSYLEADLRDPASILGHPALTETLDLSRPVGLLLVAILHFLHDDEQAAAVVAELLAALPAGSHLVLSHGTMDFSSPPGIAAYEKMYAAGGTDVRARTKTQIAAYLAGLEIVEPGIVPVSDWRPEDPAARQVTDDLGIYGMVARKP